MAIKIIKHGDKKVFTTVCPDCGCEFEYSTDDLETDWSIIYMTTYSCQYSRYVKCPECGMKIHHNNIIGTEPIYPNIISSKSSDPCEYCINKGGAKDAMGNPVAGDSPCDWCKHRMPYNTCEIK